MSDYNRHLDRLYHYRAFSNTAESSQRSTTANAAMGTRSSAASRQARRVAESQRLGQQERPSQGLRVMGPANGTSDIGQTVPRRGQRSLYPRDQSPDGWPTIPSVPGEQGLVLMSRRLHLTRLLDEASRREEAARALVTQERQNFRQLRQTFYLQRAEAGARIRSARALIQQGSPAFRGSRSGRIVRQACEDYQWEYDLLKARHRQDRANLEFVEAEHRRALRKVESSRRRLQEESPEEEEPQFILDNVQESPGDEGVTVDSLSEYEFDNDEGL